MSVIQFPDRIERIKVEIAARWRHELFLAGQRVPEADMKKALDLLVPAACVYLTADAKATALEYQATLHGGKQ